MSSCFSGCFMPLCKSWALYKDHAFFRVWINEITKWIKDWAEKRKEVITSNKFIRILKSPRDQMAKATSTSWVSVSFTRPSSGAYAFLAKLWHISHLNHLSTCFANWNFLTRSDKIMRMTWNDCTCHMSTLVEPNKREQRPLPALPASISNLFEWPTKLH